MIDETHAERVAIVTGAARGIGAGVAKRLASDGLAVAVLDLDEAACGIVAKEIDAAGGRAVAVGVDGADEAGVEAAVERVVTELGAPTVLVNNAGIIRDNTLYKMSVQDWDSVHERSFARLLPPGAGDAAIHDRGRVRPDREPVKHVCAGQPGTSELRGCQGRDPRIHEDAGNRLPDDIAHAVAFFASERAGFVSGQVLYVAGGPKA
jgi:3-oxoacyl-[acyl-carrier protein] reductase